MPDTDVNLRVNETGADRAAASMDKVAANTSKLTELAPNIARLAGGLTGMGQVARLLGKDFDALGQSITQMGIAAQGLGALGAIFGPVGQAIGTLTGIAVGAINLLRGSSAEARTERAAIEQERRQVNNNISFNIEIGGRGIEEVRAELDQTVGELMRQRQAFGGFFDADETTRVIDRSIRNR